jgi:hypothetical protein
MAGTKYSIGQLIHVLLLVHDVLEPKDMPNYVEFLRTIDRCLIESHLFCEFFTFFL